MIGPTRKPIHAHKCILAARCEVFRAMFAEGNHKSKDGEVVFVLSEMVTEVFLPMLEYLYTNSVSLTSKIVSAIRFLVSWCLITVNGLDIIFFFDAFLYNCLSLSELHELIYFLKPFSHQLLSQYLDISLAIALIALAHVKSIFV